MGGAWCYSGSEMRTWGKERVVEVCRHQTTYATVKRMNFTPNVMEKIGGLSRVVTLSNFCFKKKYPWMLYSFSVAAVIKLPRYA